MLHFEEVYIDVCWGKLAVVCCGPPSGKPILMVHGRQDSAGTFFPLLNKLDLPNDFRLIIPDLPGHGKSDSFPAGSTVNLIDFISPIKMIVEHFKLEKFAYIGHSMGAQIGLMYHVIYPNNIERFVALDSLSNIPIEAEDIPKWFKNVFEKFYNPKTYAAMNSGRSAGPTYTYEKALEIVRQSRNLTEEAGKAVLLRCLLQAENGLYRLSWDQRMKLNGSPPFGHRYQVELLGNIRIPHLAIFSSGSFLKKLALIKTHLLDAHMKNNPSYRLALVEGNHDVHLNSPELVAPYVQDFLLGGNGDKELTDQLYKQFCDIYKAQTQQMSKL